MPRHVADDMKRKRTAADPDAEHQAAVEQVGRDATNSLRDTDGRNVDAWLSHLAVFLWSKYDGLDLEGRPATTCPPERIPTESDVVHALQTEEVSSGGRCGPDHAPRLVRYVAVKTIETPPRHYAAGQHVVLTIDQHTGQAAGPDGQPLELIDRLQIATADHWPQESDNRSKPSGLQIGLAAQVHDEWRSQEHAGKHPAADLVRAWQALPPRARPNLRRDAILPARIAQVDGAALERDGRRSSGPLFTPAAHAVADPSAPGGQLIMPGFERAGVTGPCLPIHLYDLGAGNMDVGSTKQAPLALRLWIAAVRLHGQSGKRRLVVPYRELCARLWPHRLPRRSERADLMQQVDAALNSRAARVPWRGSNGKGGLLRVVSMINLPVELDDDLVLYVALPPGSGPGPVPTPRLDHYGVRSAIAYRALINLAYLWFDPGVRLVPSSKRRGAPWVPVDDPSRYPILNDRLLLELCYPSTADAKGPARRKQLERARQAIARLEADGELRIVRGHVMPPIATETERPE